MNSDQLMDDLRRGSQEIHTDETIPAYYQLSLLLKKYIFAERFEVGDQFPSEEKLIDYFDVSRPTVNKAVDLLVDEGLLKRKRGRGTFVADKKEIQLIFMQELSFQDSVGSEDVRKKTEVLVLREQKAGEYSAKSLDLEIGEPVIYLRRRRFVGDQPVLTDSFLPADMFPGLKEIDFTKKGLYSTLEKEYDAPIVKADRSVRATLILDKNIAELLGVNLFAPGLNLKGTAYTCGDKKVEHYDAILPEFALLTTTIHREHEANQNQ